MSTHPDLLISCGCGLELEWHSGLLVTACQGCGRRYLLPTESELRRATQRLRAERRADPGVTDGRHLMNRTTTSPPPSGPLRLAQ